MKNSWSNKFDEYRKKSNYDSMTAEEEKMAYDKARKALDSFKAQYSRNLTDDYYRIRKGC